MPASVVSLPPKPTDPAAADLPQFKDAFPGYSNVFVVPQFGEKPLEGKAFVTETADEIEQKRLLRLPSGEIIQPAKFGKSAASNIPDMVFEPVGNGVERKVADNTNLKSKAAVAAVGPLRVRDATSQRRILEAMAPEALNIVSVDQLDAIRDSAPDYDELAGVQEAAQKWRDMQQKAQPATTEPPTSQKQTTTHKESSMPLGRAVIQQEPPAESFDQQPFQPAQQFVQPPQGVPMGPGWGAPTRWQTSPASPPQVATPLQAWSAGQSFSGVSPVGRPALEHQQPTQYAILIAEHAGLRTRLSYQVAIQHGAYLTVVFRRGFAPNLAGIDPQQPLLLQFLDEEATLMSVRAIDCAFTHGELDFLTLMLPPQ